MPTEQARQPEDRDRPDIPEGYGVDTGVAGMLEWDRVREIIDHATIYWIATSGSAAAHLVPVHAAGLGGTIYAGGDAASRWSRNLAANPTVQVGVEFEGVQVISRGTAVLEEPGPEMLEMINAQVDRKYGFTYGPDPLPMWVLAPQTVIAFDPGEFATSPTRFRFKGQTASRR